MKIAFIASILLAAAMAARADQIDDFLNAAPTRAQTRTQRVMADFDRRAAAVGFGSYAASPGYAGGGYYDSAPVVATVPLQPGLSIIGGNIFTPRMSCTTLIGGGVVCF